MSVDFGLQSRVSVEFHTPLDVGNLQRQRQHSKDGHCGVLPLEDEWSASRRDAVLNRAHAIDLAANHVPRL